MRRMQPDKYLEQIISPLVTKPEAIRITSTTDEMGVLLSVVVAREDMGSVIGKAGETAKAIRHLIRVAGVKQNARVSVKINEPDGSAYRPREKKEEVI